MCSFYFVGMQTHLAAGELRASLLGMGYAPADPNTEPSPRLRSGKIDALSCNPSAVNYFNFRFCVVRAQLFSNDMNLQLGKTNTSIERRFYYYHQV